ncbi:Uncharacterised protein [Mycobacteroides abscessus subsp. abscessus]|nr:Uncharacterised protein [Mycobacteroides abscessus subsp. abscessus]
MKKMLPATPFLTSRMTSARASSTSARTRAETWVVASRTRLPMVGSPVPVAFGSDSGMAATVIGTPLLSVR